MCVQKESGVGRWVGAWQSVSINAAAVHQDLVVVDVLTDQTRLAEHPGTEQTLVRPGEEVDQECHPVPGHVSAGTLLQLPQ